MQAASGFSYAVHCVQPVPETTWNETCDPVLGARFRLNLKKGWFATLKGDVGGFGAGSELSWQIYSGVGKEFKQKYSLLLAYRRLDVDYRNSGFVFDTKMNGVMLGFAVRLK